MEYKIPKQLQKTDFRFVKLKEWDIWGRYENVNNKRKIVEKKNFTPKQNKDLDKNQWEALGKPHMK